MARIRDHLNFYGLLLFEEVTEAHLYFGKIDVKVAVISYQILTTSLKPYCQLDSSLVLLYLFWLFDNLPGFLLLESIPGRSRLLSFFVSPAA
jgi:hypothetical protein